MKTIDIRKGDTWTMGDWLWQYRDGQSRIVRPDGRLGDWTGIARLSGEQDCTQHTGGRRLRRAGLRVAGYFRQLRFGVDTAV
mgnify:CR=1 FL=1